MKNRWELDTEYYNREVVKCDVYRKKFRHGYVYIQNDINKHFSYTYSFGADSNHSFSGSFYGSTVVTDISKAMDALDLLTVLWLDNDKDYSRIKKRFF